MNPGHAVMVQTVRPRIGITTNPSSHVSPTLEIERPLVTLDAAYVEAVVIAGGTPVLLPPVDAAHVGDMVGGLDALLLSGGGDIDPTCYGAERTPETEGVDQARDAFEFALLDAAQDVGLPVLAVCRGMQVLNVSRGGTLLQHVPHVTHNEHKDTENWDVSANPVAIDEGTRLHQLCGGRHLTVNSLHHQAVDRLGANLRCTARDADGIVEAIEATDDRSIIGVQWHPELLISEPEHEALFVWLVNEANGRVASVGDALVGDGR